MGQTWMVNGQHLNQEQMRALAEERQRAREAGKELDKEVVSVEVKTTPEDPEKAEFERLKSERAWLKPDFKDRYNQLKAKYAN